jgi:outer membrane protein OmpA-like peptidoglycan-associated protein
MNYTMRTTTLCCGIIAGLATACAPPPSQMMNPALEQARAEYTAAKNDTMVVAKAPVALKKAEEALSLSERSWQKKAPTVIVEHQAYLAQKQARIAHQTAVLKSSEEMIAGARLGRQEIQLEARDREAKQAAMEAAAAKTQTKIATMEAEAAKTQAKLTQEAAQAHIAKLTKQLNDLQAEQTKRGMVLTLKDVLFDVGKSDLKPGTHHVIDQLAAFLVEYPERKVLIEGHTDNVGSESSNQDLSQRRAEAVRQALMFKGVASERISARGYGESYPVATNDTNEGRQQNRRVEVIFSDDQGKIIER